jgi:3-deoxy-D-manno-octulosonic-acid transferase|tara:strand:+ start:1088 stop:2317 length:1230 start_codon:yes stop_codon:yes gene_type:complete
MYLYLPVAILKLIQKDRDSGLWKIKLKNQLGRVNIKANRVIWLHCVSVGEFHAARPLIDQLIELFSDHKILITTTTTTGSTAVKNYYGGNIEHCFFPFDLPFALKRFIKNVKPEICILLETELWPNLIYFLHKRAIPIALVNARLSQRSLAKYQKSSAKLAHETIKKITLIASQNEHSSERFLALGANPDTLHTIGSLKFDSNLSADAQITENLRHITGDRRIVVFASTRSGEEKEILQSYINLKEKFDALLVIVPRHPERFDDVYKLIIDNKLNLRRRSENEPCDKDTQILLGDSMGELMSYYSICDIAFIGGSLTSDGGQNMLEAAASSKPVLFGPHVFNFEYVSQLLIDNGGAIQVSNADQLMHTIAGLLSDDGKRIAIGTNAKKIIEDNRGVTNQLIELLAPQIN